MLQLRDTPRLGNYTCDVFARYFHELARIRQFHCQVMLYFDIFFGLSRPCTQPKKHFRLKFLYHAISLPYSTYRLLCFRFHLDIASLLHLFFFCWLRRPGDDDFIFHCNIIKTYGKIFHTQISIFLGKALISLRFEQQNSL